VGNCRFSRGVFDHVRIFAAGDQDLPHQIRKRLEPLGDSPVPAGDLSLADLRNSPQEFRNNPG